MAKYIASKIISGSQQYSFVFSVPVYRRYQEEVDAILIAEGRQDLIVEMPK